MGDLSFMGKGRTFLGLKSGGALHEVGNVGKLDFSVDEEFKGVPDYTTAGGGKRNSVSRISAVKMSMSAFEWTVKNLEVALRAVGATVAAGAVVDEAHTAYLGGLVKFANLPDLTVAPVIKNTAGTVTYVAGTDYELLGAGILPLAGGDIVDAAGIKVSYTKLAGNLIQALTTAALEYKLVFVGLNEYDSGKPVVVTVHRLKFGATKGLGLITTEAGPLDLEGEVLSDASITGAGLSKFLTVEMAT